MGDFAQIFSSVGAPLMQVFFIGLVGGVCFKIISGRF